MQLANVQLNPVHDWLRNGHLRAELDSANQVEIFRRDSNRWQLDMYVARWSTVLSRMNRDLEELEKIRGQAPAEFPLAEVELLSNHEILNLSDRLAMLAEDALDWRERFELRIADLERVRQVAGVWSHEADSLLLRFRHFHDLVTWRESVCRVWAQKSLDILEERDPSDSVLPFKPIDLGPTNSARLPSVL